MKVDAERVREREKRERDRETEREREGGREGEGKRRKGGMEREGVRELRARLLVECAARTVALCVCAHTRAHVCVLACA